MAAKKHTKPHQPVIENRRARYNFHIEATLECGIRLTGTEVKSVRNGQVSLAEGYVRATEDPLQLTLHGAHIAEYAPASPARQHDPIRVRMLLAHKREILKLADHTRAKGQTLVPLKMYFTNGKAKILVGLARGKQHHDKRQDLAEKQAKRDIARATSQRRK
jgi:SsrA-binding protein